MKKFLKRVFGTITEEEALKMNLIKYCDVDSYDEPEIECDSLWIDKKGRTYKIKNK